MYIPHERRARILRLLSERGTLRSAELAEELEVTDETVRTDLISLQREGLLKRVHGGAIYLPPRGGSSDARRADVQLITRILPWIGEEDVLYADACPLLLALANQLQHQKCCVLTPSLDMVAALAAPAMKEEVVLPGGKLRKDEGIIEPLPGGGEQFFRRMGLKLAVLCPDALGETAGQIAYRGEVQAQWAKAASRTAQRTLIVLPSGSLQAEAKHNVACRANCILTHREINYPGAKIELVPLPEENDGEAARSSRGLSPPLTPPYVPFMAYGGFLTFADNALQ